MTSKKHFLNSFTQKINELAPNLNFNKKKFFKFKKPSNPLQQTKEVLSKKSKFSEIELKEFRERMKEHNIIVKLNRTAKDIIVENGYNEKYGARPLQRAIQTYIEDPIAEEMLQGTLKTGMVASLSYDKRTDKIKVSSRDAVQGIDY